tara:strand:- start:20 stop:292 length:273 start_codon:yes stop_codon:yes gene_type:complete
MNKLITTAAILFMPVITFAQCNLSQRSKTSPRDTVSYQRIDLTIILHDLEDIYTWQQEDINSDRHVCEYSHELLRATIEDLRAKLCEITD